MLWVRSSGIPVLPVLIVTMDATRRNAGVRKSGLTGKSAVSGARLSKDGARRVNSLQNLQELFPSIAPDVIELMLESCNGKADEAMVFLSDMDHQIRNEKTPQPDVLSDDSGTVLSTGTTEGKSSEFEEASARPEEHRLNVLAYQFHPQLSPLMETHLDPNPTGHNVKPVSPLPSRTAKSPLADSYERLRRAESDLDLQYGIPSTWRDCGGPPLYIPYDESRPTLTTSLKINYSSGSSSGHDLNSYTRSRSDPGKNLNETNPESERFGFPLEDVSSRSDGLSSGFSSSNGKGTGNHMLDFDDETNQGVRSSDSDLEVAASSRRLEADTSSSPMVLQLDKDIACRLMMTFGLMQVPIDTNDDSNLTVQLDMHLAYKIYQAWKTTQESLAQTNTNAETEGDEWLHLGSSSQELEHENYAEDGLKNLSMKEIMDETYALRLAERESEERGMDVGSALQYQSSDGVQSKWVSHLLKSHNVISDSAFPALDGKARNVHAEPRRHLSSTAAPQVSNRQSVSPVAHRSASTGERPGGKYLMVTAVAPAPVVRPLSDPRNEPVDYYGMRREAIELQKKAIAYGEKAGKAFTNKKLGGGAAAYYLQKSHEHKTLAKEAHWEASEQILASRNVNATDGEIDLHGLRCDEVSMALDGFFARRHKSKELKIISGRGVHSRTGTSEVRRAVEVYLKKHDHQFEEGPPVGVFYVDQWKKLHARPP